MANLNVLSSYLVKLGWEIDQPGLARFKSALDDARKEVEKATDGIMGAFVKAGGAIVGALTTIATATVALADHVAEADLGYQLFAQRMFMSTAAAREMKIATDALGHSLDEIAWNPELRERYFQLLADQRVMAKQLGPDYESEIRKVRDLRFEFTRLQVAITYLGMAVTNSLSRALFGDENALLNKLHYWNDWLEHNLSRVSDKIAQYLVPVLRDVKAIWTDIADIAIKVVGTLFDDERMKSGALNIDTVGRALDHVSSAVRTLFDYLDKIATIFTDHPVLTKMFGGALAGAKAGKWIPGVGPEAGAMVGGSVGLAKGLYDYIALSHSAIRKYIRDQAEAAGLNTSIALAVASRESGFNPNARGSKGEIGLFQLMPETARQLGVDPSDPFQNMQGGIQLLLHLKGKYHDWTRTLEAYNAGERAVDTGHIPLSSQTYAEEVLRGAKGFGYTGGPTTITTNVGDIHIHTQPGQSPHDIAKETKRVLQGEQRKQLKQN